MHCLIWMKIIYQNKDTQRKKSADVTSTVEVMKWMLSWRRYKEEKQRWSSCSQAMRCYWPNGVCELD